MSAEKLAFLQNFYTDVTLYVPAEPCVVELANVELTVPAEPTAVTIEPTATPSATLPTKAPPIPTEVRIATPPKPAREIALPPTGFSRPSAGLERLASSFNHPVSSSEQAATASERATEAHLPRPAPTATPTVPPVMLTPFTTLGDNAQGVILLFRLPQEQFIRLHRNVFLNKMLQALNYVMADVMLVNVDSDLPVALVNLRRELAATHIVAFGKNLLDTTIRNTQIYEPVQFSGLNLSYLASATVDLVEYDVSLKKRLWPGLQRMFLG